MRQEGGNIRDIRWPLARSVQGLLWDMVWTSGKTGDSSHPCPLCDFLSVVQAHVSSSDQQLLSIQQAIRRHMAGWASSWWILFM